MLAEYNKGTYTLYFNADETGDEIMAEAEKAVKRAAMQALLNEQYTECTRLIRNAERIQDARREKEKPDTLTDTEPKDKDIVSHLPGDSNNV